MDCPPFISESVWRGMKADEQRFVTEACDESKEWKNITWWRVYLSESGERRIALLLDSGIYRLYITPTDGTGNE